MGFYSKSFIGDFVPYYELFFKDKNFKKTAQNLAELLKKLNPKLKDILDFGCGSGIYTKLLSEYGFSVVGVDISADMITYAKAKNAHKNAEYFVGDIREFSLEKRFDCVVLLSHVICYQVQNIALLESLSNTFKHLKEGGILLFDFYHQAGILKQGISPRIKQVRDNDTRITRFSEAKFSYLDNALKLSYQYFIENEGKKNLFLKSKDKMRFFSVMELEYYLKNIGFREVDFYKNLQCTKIDENCSSGFVVARK